MAEKCSTINKTGRLLLATGNKLTGFSLDVSGLQPPFQKFPPCVVSVPPVSLPSLCSCSLRRGVRVLIACPHVVTEQPTRVKILLRKQLKSIRLRDVNFVRGREKGTRGGRFATKCSVSLLPGARLPVPLCLAVGCALRHRLPRAQHRTETALPFPCPERDQWARGSGRACGRDAEVRVPASPGA